MASIPASRADEGEGGGAPAALVLEHGAPGGPVARLSGRWTLAGLARGLDALQAQLGDCAREGEALFWDLGAVHALDSVGATLLWRAWGRRLPSGLAAKPEQVQVFERMAAVVPAAAAQAPARFDWLARIGVLALGFARQVADFVALLGDLAIEAGRCIRGVARWPWRETTANLYKAGVRAMPVAALVGFLIGVVLSYLSALQLKSFGADIFIVNILGLGIIREIGPVLVAVLVAGRSGSAMTAQLGVMRVTEEIDALATMGVSRTLRLVLPKVAALAVAMPLLVLWTSSVALLGGMVSAYVQLDIGYGFFIETLPRVVPVANLWIGLAKGGAFGIVVSLIACHFGLRVRPNTDSLAANTTASVVAAITAVILVDALFAIATRNIGLPR
ncbi:MAG TPA: ABC transporter permease [Rhodocyclaceae bacterium]|nr:MAG: ABC transporter permease [Betaproteobacteria bacterium CG2_30_68_42]PIX74223.1 MAG: ABC transporter permease [Rhodocyclales bacterium CG_4_10_14_3_um_filter_68_10]PJA57222.1 MAG: ABC transporter permease [Rhodocyclales bacterium CG_4_9_14_3_um_filter_68_10]HCX34951.1 ABC transporter permease [Rhodocyclaceae bacterium]